MKHLTKPSHENRVTVNIFNSNSVILKCHTLLVPSSHPTSTLGKGAVDDACLRGGARHLSGFLSILFTLIFLFSYHYCVCSSSLACHIASCVAALAAMYSASMLDRATDVCMRLCHETGPPEMRFSRACLWHL